MNNKNVDSNILKLEQELESQLEVMNQIEVGSEEQENATKSLERTTNAYCEMLKTKEDIKLNRISKIFEIVGSIATITLGILKIKGGIEAMKQLSVLEAIDESNGDIPSMAIRNQKSIVNTVIRNWISGK